MILHFPKINTQCDQHIQNKMHVFYVNLSDANLGEINRLHLLGNWDGTILAPPVWLSWVYSNTDFTYSHISCNERINQKLWTVTPWRAVVSCIISMPFSDHTSRQLRAPRSSACSLNVFLLLHQLHSQPSKLSNINDTKRLKSELWNRLLPRN